jgi:hypothetical protein
MLLQPISLTLDQNVVDAGSSGFGDLFDMFAADGGMIRDPNRPDGDPVRSNLSFAQQNPVAMRMAQSIRPRSSVAGYADGESLIMIPSMMVRTSTNMDSINVKIT